MSLTCPAARSGPARSGGGSAGSRADRSTGGPPASLYNGELRFPDSAVLVADLPPTDTFWTAGRWSLTRCCSSAETFTRDSSGRPRSTPAKDTEADRLAGTRIWV